MKQFDFHKIDRTSVAQSITVGGLLDSPGIAKALAKTVHARLDGVRSSRFV